MKYRLYAFFVACFLGVKVREKMALKLISERVRQTGYLAVCFFLLLYTLSGLMFQGGMWLLAGIFCWFGIVSSFFVSNIYRYNKRRLFEVSSLKTEKPNSKKDESDKSILGFRFLPWWTAIMGILMIINKMRIKQKSCAVIILHKLGLANT